MMDKEVNKRLSALYIFVIFCMLCISIFSNAYLLSHKYTITNKDIMTSKSLCGPRGINSFVVDTNNIIDLKCNDGEKYYYIGGSNEN